MQLNHFLLSVYEKLNAYFGNLHWWPAESPYEVIIGAILTQNTAWKNVEISIMRLKEAGLLSPEAIERVDDHMLADVIRPAGYYRIKTRRIKEFNHFLYEHYHGNVGMMFAENLWHLREKLVKIKGIGEETADSILLYAAQKPIFVVDAYTRRILQRHGIIRTDATYQEIQNLFMNHLPHDVSLFNQYHALLVQTGKHFCNKTPRCEECPLGM